MIIGCIVPSALNIWSGIHKSALKRYNFAILVPIPCRQTNQRMTYHQAMTSILPLIDNSYGNIMCVCRNCQFHIELRTPCPSRSISLANLGGVGRAGCPFALGTRLAMPLQGVSAFTDSYTLRVHRAQVRVFEERDQKALHRLLQSPYSGRLKTQSRLKVLGDFPNKALERKFAD
jgi:hypothetical protein